MIPIFLSILSGLLLSAGFPKPAMFFLSWVALVPLLQAIRNKTGKQALGLGFICGLAHCLTCLWWIHHAVYHFGGLSPVASLLILLLLCSIMALYPALFALMAQKCDRPASALCFWAAVCLGCTRMGPGVRNLGISMG